MSTRLDAASVRRCMGNLADRCPQPIRFRVDLTDRRQGYLCAVHRANQPLRLAEFDRIVSIHSGREDRHA